MLVIDFFKLCRAGVTKQFILDDATLLAYLNLATIELYKKFDMAMREQVITLDSTHHEYKLIDDVMRISAVYTDAKYLGKYPVGSSATTIQATIVSLPINDDDDVDSVYTPTTGILLVPYPKDNQIISVIYKASPVVYTTSDLETKLDIEVQYISPLVMYIGYMANLALEGGQGQSVMLLSMFTQACDDIVKYGLHSTHAIDNDKLTMRGFV